jgi:hypothetical protein
LGGGGRGEGMGSRTGLDGIAKRKSSYKKPRNRTPVTQLFP